MLQVIRSLKHALQPAVTGTKVHFSLPFGYTAKVVPEQVPPIFFGERTIVYGILQKNLLGKVVSGSKGTVTLEGELLGEKIKHVLEFEAPRQGAGQPQLVPTIHHLAGKALIKGLQNEESAGSKKDEIVKLSCECSVISKHTAFIAIDEDQKEPVKGSLQTWDVVAPPPLMEMNCAMRSCSRSLFVRRAVASASSSDSEDDELLDECCEDNLVGECDLVGLEKGMACESFPTFGGDDSLGSFKELDDEVVVKGDRDLVNFDPPCTTRSSAPPPPLGGAAQPKPSSSQPALPRIISLQLASGAWKLSAELAALLGHSMEELKTACPAACEGEMELVWATVLVLGYLEKKLLELKDEWELIAMKANNWLKKQRIPEGHSKESFLEKAKTVM